MKGEVLPIILILAGVLIASQTGLLSISQLGFTTLSASPATFQSSNSQLNGEVWVLTVTPYGMGQSAKGATLPSQTIGATDGKTSQQPLEIQINSQDNKCEYPIQQDTSAFNVYTFGYKKYLKLTSDSDMVANCGSLGQVVSYGSFPISLDKACIYRNVRGLIGNINEPHYFMSVDTSIQKGSDAPIHKILSNKGQLTASYSDIAYAQWSGGLNTYDTCPIASQYAKTAMYDIYSASWRITDSSKYSNYKSIVQPQQNYDFKDENTLSNAVNYWNSLSDQAMSSVGFYSLKGFPASSPSGDTNNGIVSMDIDDAIQIPIITFYIKTAWLTIVQPVAKPIITSVNFPDLTTGANNPQTVGYITVRNDGESGVIQTYVECSNPLVIPISGTVQRSIIKGTSESMAYTLSAGSVISKQTVGCTAIAKSLNNENRYGFNVNVNPLKVCEPNFKSCELNKIVQCNSEGSQKSVIQDCGTQGLYCGTGANGQIACLSDGGGGGSTCAVENEATGGILGVGKKACCQFATDGITPLIEKNGICIRQEGFPLFEVGIIVLIIGALVATTMLK